MNNIITLKPKAGVELLAIVVDKDVYDIKDTYCNGIMWKRPSGYKDSIYFDEINKDLNYSILGCVEYNKPIEFDAKKVAESLHLNSLQTDFIMYAERYKYTPTQRQKILNALNEI